MRHGRCWYLCSKMSEPPAFVVRRSLLDISCNVTQEQHDTNIDRDVRIVNESFFWIGSFEWLVWTMCSKIELNQSERFSSPKHIDPHWIRFGVSRELMEEYFCVKLWTKWTDDIDEAKSRFKFSRNCTNKTLRIRVWCTPYDIGLHKSLFLKYFINT